MRKLSIVLTVLLAVTGIVSIKLWHDLQAGRQELVALKAQGTGGGSIRAAQPIQSAVGTAGAASSAPDTACISDPQHGTVPNEEFVARMEALYTRIPGPFIGLPEDKYLLKDPEYLRARLTQVRIAMAHDNPGLAEAVGLSEPEATHLFEQMAEGHLALLKSAAAGKDNLSVAELIDTGRREGVKQEDLASTTLGSDKYARLERYRRDVRPALVQVENLSNLLSYAGEPLTEFQKGAIKNAMATEQQYAQQQTAMPQVRSGSTTKPQSSVQIFGDVIGRLEEKNRKIFEAAAPSLSAAQIAVLRKELEKEASRNRFSLKTMAGQ